MKKLSLNQMQNLQGGKFWGTESKCVENRMYDIISGKETLCMRTCTQKHYFFWMVVGYSIDIHNCYSLL